VSSAKNTLHIEANDEVIDREVFRKSWLSLVKILLSFQLETLALRSFCEATPGNMRFLLLRDTAVL